MSTNIDGVVVSPRRIIPDDRGKVIHMLKATDPEFETFGEIYFSQVFPDVVKGWHLHQRMTIHYAVPVGIVKLVLFDGRVESPTHGLSQEIYVGEGNHVLVKVPPRIWNGFQGVGIAPALVANCASIPHDPSEIQRLDPHDPIGSPIGSFTYDWSRRDR